MVTVARGSEQKLQIVSDFSLFSRRMSIAGLPRRALKISYGITLWCATTFGPVAFMQESYGQALGIKVDPMRGAPNDHLEPSSVAAARETYEESAYLFDLRSIAAAVSMAPSTNNVYQMRAEFLGADRVTPASLKDESAKNFVILRARNDQAVATIECLHLLRWHERVAVHPIKGVPFVAQTGKPRLARQARSILEDIIRWPGMVSVSDTSDLVQLKLEKLPAVTLQRHVMADGITTYKPVAK